MRPINHIFDNLILYSGNRFAYTAAVCVAEAPGKAFNPLFLYGATGNGKTHLMQAIGNKIKFENPDWRIVYCTAHQFRNLFIKSIGANQTTDFYNYFQSADVLLFDDLDLLSGLEQTQEALFHIFNDLLSRGKQIVFASLHPPKKLDGFDERIKTRFSWGLITDTQAPHAEEFLQEYFSKIHTRLRSEVTQKLMDQEYSNVADLLGALRQFLPDLTWGWRKDMENQADHIGQDLKGKNEIEYGQDIWKAVLDEIAKDLNAPSFETWFRPASAIVDGDTLKIFAPNQFSADWMELRYKQNLSDAVEKVLGKRLILQFAGLEGQSFTGEPTFFQQNLESLLPDLEQERNCEQEGNPEQRWIQILGELREMKELAKDSLLERQRTNALLEEILRRFNLE